VPAADGAQSVRRSRPNTNISLQTKRVGNGNRGGIAPTGVGTGRRRGRALFLETQNVRNVHFYRKQGFRVVSDGEGPGRFGFGRC
jgi:hypothetical protein